MITARCLQQQGRLSLELATFEHSDGRGMGGAKRDDRIYRPNRETGKMEPFNAVACPWCNTKKGSRSLSAALADLIP